MSFVLQYRKIIRSAVNYMHNRYGCLLYTSNIGYYAVPDAEASKEPSSGDSLPSAGETADVKRLRACLLYTSKRISNR